MEKATLWMCCWRCIRTPVLSGQTLTGDCSPPAAADFGGNPRVTLIEMTNPMATDNFGSEFDVIQLNAVFEHLVPQERKKLMPDLWQRLRLGGYLVLTETPWRWFPIETHTTGLPFVNYMPDRLALAAVRYRHSKSLAGTMPSSTACGALRLKKSFHPSAAAITP